MDYGEPAKFRDYGDAPKVSGKTPGAFIGFLKKKKAAKKKLGFSPMADMLGIHFGVPKISGMGGM
jgi:hypothetical protein